METTVLARGGIAPPVCPVSRSAAWTRCASDFNIAGSASTALIEINAAALGRFT